MIRRALTQTAVYWHCTGKNQYNEPTFADPVQVNCRWEDKANIVKNKQGEDILSKSQAFVGQFMDEEDYLYLGKLENLTTAQQADPRLVSSAWEIKSTVKVPSFSSNKEFLRIMYLG